MAMSTIFLLYMHEDDSQKPLLLSETSGGRPKQLSDLKHVSLEEAGYELSVEPF